jgi:hypothetical protein
MRYAASAIMALAMLACPVAGRAAGSFDGHYTVRLVCDSANNGVGYTVNFYADVKNGVLHGERGTEGQAGWFVLDGPIGTTGDAMLQLKGLTGGTAYNMGQTASGAPYGYAVKAHFDGSGGTGTRLGAGARHCTFDFSK